MGDAVAADANVADLAASAAANWPAVTALVDSSSELALTWQQVDNAVNAVAATLRESGVAPGDRVVVRLPTSSAYAVAVFGVLRAGGIAVPSSPQAPGAELRGLLAHSGATTVFTTAEDVEWPAESGTVLPPPDLDAVAEPVEPVTSGEDIAMLCYTTAAKGAPRGVMVSHRALLANVEQVGRLRPAPVAHGDRMLVAIPLFHVYGFGLGLLQVAARGATAVLAERFDAAKALDDCRRHKITIVMGVPTMYREFAEHPTDELTSGLASVRLLTSGAAPLHPKVLAAIEEATGLGVYEGYGLTETAPVLTSTIVTGYPKPGSVGRPIPGVELRLIGNDGAEIGAPVPLDDDDPDDLLEEDDVTGLVTVRGDNLFSGYWPDGHGGPDADGWFQTYDVGYLDTDGDLHLVDRVNDLIIVNGFNVYPHEVEDVIAELDSVAEVAVIGVVDERSGEAVKAVVVVAPSAALSEQQVVDHCAEHLARYKVPSFVEFADELPHTATGKLSRTPLR
ncbi:MAG: AMP-binding protein [Actinophytocola sp.]|nr:AMP-binding protein [Actinophytocola sp.]